MLHQIFVFRQQIPQRVRLPFHIFVQNQMRIRKNTGVEQARSITLKEKFALAQQGRQRLESVAGIGFEIAHVDKV